MTMSGIILMGVSIVIENLNFVCLIYLP